MTYIGTYAPTYGPYLNRVTPPQQAWDIYFIDGQSNPQGLGPVPKLYEAPLNTVSPSLTRRFNTPIVNPAARAVERLYVGTGADGSGNNLGQQHPEAPPEYANGFGPEIELAQLLDKNGKKAVIIKVVRGATQLVRFLKSTNDLYPHFGDYLSIARAYIEAQGGTVGNVFFLWDQKEADYGNRNYLTQFTQLISDLRADNVLKQNSPIAIAAVRNGNPNDPDSVYPAQLAYVASDPTAGLISTDNYPLLPDGVHYNEIGQLMYGADVYNYFNHTNEVADLGSVVVTPPATDKPQYSLNNETRYMRIYWAGADDQLMVSIENGPFVPYTGPIDVAKVAHLAGYLRAYVKEASGRPQSGTAESEYIPPYVAGEKDLLKVDSTTPNNTPSQWYDQSGLGNHLVQPDVSRRLELVQDGQGTWVYKTEGTSFFPIPVLSADAVNVVVILICRLLSNTPNPQFALDVPGPNGRMYLPIDTGIGQSVADGWCAMVWENGSTQLHTASGIRTLAPPQTMAPGWDLRATLGKAFDSEGANLKALIRSLYIRQGSLSAEDKHQILAPLAAELGFVA